MLIPRFTTRSFLLTVFLLTLVLGPLLAAVGSGAEGTKWASAFFVGMLSIAGCFTMYALTFALTWMFVESRLANQKPEPQSPFATDAPPKQVIPPLDD